MTRCFKRRELSEWWWSLHLLLAFFWLAGLVWYCSHWFSFLWVAQWVLVTGAWLLCCCGKLRLKESAVAQDLNMIFNCVVMPPAVFFAQLLVGHNIILGPILLFFATYMIMREKKPVH